MSLLHLDPTQRPGSAAEVLARVNSAVSGGAFDSATFAAEPPHQGQRRRDRAS